MTATEFFCEDCGSCTQDVNEDCYRSHHCQFCSDCIHDGEYHEGIFNQNDEYICYDCADMLIELGDVSACHYCHELFGEGVVECDCGAGDPHCTDCIEIQCEVCGKCMVVAGEDTDAVSGDACVDHATCGECMPNAAADDLIHCRECFNCDEDICAECGLCESCAAYEEHCPECGYCFGDEVQWCANEGEHCINCCNDNDWICPSCDKCTEAVGTYICDECELCEQCCLQDSEGEGCTHGYCTASADFYDHLCPECDQCPDDEACDYCGLCASCQADYHCQHELCPDGSEWDDHVCPDCGECFDDGELCEYCGLCEDCREHCEHDFCPENDDDSEHFICDQCGDCFEAIDRCDECLLCSDCCDDNTQAMGCDHGLCIESGDFAEHWCYEDDQCLDLCEHDEDCEHLNVNTAWRIDGNAHWQVCEDCGIALSKSQHTGGEPVTLTAPNAATHTNGTAQVNCSVCNYKMGIISVAYVEATADGRPYIINQPTNYTGKTNTSAHKAGDEDRYATFKVKAGGEGLTYQWYEQYGTNTPKVLKNDDYNEGVTTASLKVLVYYDECGDQNWHKYYCVVSNSKGSVTSDGAYMNPVHVFGRYVSKDSEKHENYCWGDCYVVKSTSKHRFSEWTLARAATSDETGLREQACMDCGYKNTEVIPKVEPDHVHSYDIAKYGITQHWFVCSCGIAGPDGRADHVFDQTEVVTPATETKKGENKIICSACGYFKTERTDMLPHEHDWWAEYNDPTKGSRGPESHTAKCKGCNEKKTETHAWGMFENLRDAKIQAGDTISGRIVRYCEICSYADKQLYPLGSWPIMIAGGTAYHAKIYIKNKTVTFLKTTPAAYAKANDVIIIEYDPKAAMAMNYDNKPVKFKQWVDGTNYTGDENIPWDGGKSSIDLPRLTFSYNTQSRAWIFTMPDGPATVFAVTEECKHTGSTKTGERVEATCSSHGHEPHTLCADCGEVLSEGARIPALGHDLPSTPIAGTEVVEYCTIFHGSTLFGAPNETKYGYSGEYVCNRCNQTVKGERTPLAHGLHDKNRTYTSNPGMVWTGYQKWVKATNPPSCTKAGHDDDLYCNYCDKLIKKGERVEAYGHDWEEWNVVRQATTKVKGLERRVCAYDESHVETRIIDYTGPDYTLKPNKTRLYFEWVYGDPIPSQTITFRSTGRDSIVAITNVVEENDWDELSLDGMTLTVTPILDNELYNRSGENTMALWFKTLNKEGETIDIYFPDPEITTICNIKKTPEKYTLTVVDGVATTFTYNSSGQRVLDTKTSSKLEIRGGENVLLEPDETRRGDFRRWVIVDDASGLISNTSTWENCPIHMSPNNVTVRAIYKTMGDVNSDGEISITDVCMVIERIKGIIPTGFKRADADMDGDGEITVKDLNKIVEIVLSNKATGAKARRNVRTMMRRLKHQLK